MVAAWNRGFAHTIGRHVDVSGMEATTHREFCGSCHVMTGHYLDSSNPLSQSLAARHSRNPFTGTGVERERVLQTGQDWTGGYSTDRSVEYGAHDVAVQGREACADG